MDANGREYAPIWLYSLAGCALVLSLLASQFEPPPNTPGGRALLASQSHPRDARARILQMPPPALRTSHAPKLATRSLFPDPSLDLALGPVRPVWRAPARRRTSIGLEPPLALHAVNGAPAELVLLLPGERAWPVRRRAPSDPVGRLLGWLRDWSVRDAPNAWRTVKAHARRLPEYLELGRAVLEEAEKAGTIHSPPLAGPIITYPTDRLAMLPRAAAQRPRLEIRRREAAAPPSVAPPEPAEPALDPAALREQLQRLTEDAEAEAWARRALDELSAVTRARVSSQGFEPALERLSATAREGRRLADDVRRHATAVVLRRAAYAIQRRAPAWAIAERIKQRDALRMVCTPSATDERVRDSLRALAASTDQSDHGDAWQSYLRTALVDEALGADGQMTLGERRRLAQDVLARITSPQLSAQQRRFVASGAVAALGDELNYWAAEPVDVDALLEKLEAYEASPGPARAARIAEELRRLERSGAEAHRALASRVERDYRNANLRVAIAAELLRRQLPAPAPSIHSVRERIAGAPVRGTATTTTELDVRLTPDPHAWRIAIEARGAVNSRTVSRGGPASLHAAGATAFVARKPVSLTARGLAAEPATCDADAHTRLLGVRTDFDGVLLVSDFIRSRARSEYRANRARAQWHAENRVSDRLKLELDNRAAEALARVEDQVRAQFLARAERLGLAVEPIELRTTDTRVIARVRLANDRQLAAHTPRNRAPADSVFSMQLHESAINNALAGLGLAGRAMKADDLRALLNEKLRFERRGEGDPLEASAAFLFNAQRPMRVEFVDGRVHLVLAFDEMVVDGRLFRDFKVHAQYRAEATIDGASLVQEEPVQIEAQIRASTRAHLHAVFGKMMPPGRRVPLVAASPEQRARLEGLMVTQLVVEDGWFGVAIGPHAADRVAQRGRYTR